MTLLYIIVAVLMALVVAACAMAWIEDRAIRRDNTDLTDWPQRTVRGIELRDALGDNDRSTT